MDNGTSHTLNLEVNGESKLATAAGESDRPEEGLCVLEREGSNKSLHVSVFPVLLLPSSLPCSSGFLCDIFPKVLFHLDLSLPVGCFAFRFLFWTCGIMTVHFWNMPVTYFLLFISLSSVEFKFCHLFSFYISERLMHSTYVACYASGHWTVYDASYVLSTENK